MIEKARVLEQLGWLLHGSAENKRTTGFIESFGEGLDGVCSRGIDRHHIAEAEDYDGRKDVYVCGGVDEFLSCAEEKRSVDA